MIQELPAVVPIVGGGIAGLSAALSTLIIGLAYIDVLKSYKQAQLDGSEMPLSELARMLKEKIEYYTQMGWDILKPQNYSSGNWILE